MIKELFFLNEPCEFKKGILIYPPKVREVIKDSFFNFYVHILTYSQEEIEDDFMKDGQFLENYPTPFEYLLNNSYHNKEYEKYALQAFEFFTKQKVVFLYEAKAIAFGSLNELLNNLNKIDDLILLKEEDFFNFQNLIRESVGKKTIQPPDSNEHPRIKEMKRKARYRDKVKQKQKEKEGVNFYTHLVSICCMGLGITPLNIGEISYVAIIDIVTKYQDKEKYGLDIETILAGGDPKKIEPKYWIRNFNQ